MAPMFHDLGARTLQTYSRSGILDAVADETFPVSDALFTRKHGRYVCHPHGPVYLYVTRTGMLQLAGQGASDSLAHAMLGFAHLARPGELEGRDVVEGATEWFPPPRFLLAVETSRLYIAAVHAAGFQGPGFLPFGEYVDERAELFATAFRNAH
jgi:hypothetical protein